MCPHTCSACPVPGAAPACCGAAIPAGLKGRGWSDARAFSHTQLLKNPNAYFYRHVAPHEQQAGCKPRPANQQLHAFATKHAAQGFS